jgi:triphosphoribosyl-dephospho-CoA synthase
MTNVDAPPMLRGALTTADIAAAAQLACLLEASAPKPGNVSPGRHFADARYEDFLASAVAIGDPLAGAATRGVGATVRLAVEATARWTRSNTNLGLVLLLAPLARAAQGKGDGSHFRPVEKAPPEKGDGSHFRDAGLDLAGHARGGPAGDGAGEMRPVPFSQPVHGGAAEMTPVPFSLRQALRRVLEETTVEDAREVYAAIRCAAPGGLGRADAQDVADEPTVTLLDAMRLAAERDGIAHEYATAFDVTFGTGVPALDRARAAGLAWDDAVVQTFLTILAARPDTHIARRGGGALAAQASQQARTALDAGGVTSDSGRRAIDAMDQRMREPRNIANPGTTADLTAAAIFVVLLGGGWRPDAGGRPDAAQR